MIYFLLYNYIFETMDKGSQKKSLEKQLNDLLWGSVEIREVKGGQYIYLHKRIN